MFKQFREIYRYREAIRNFVVRDLKVRYSNSVLGIVWSLLNPLLMALVFTIVFTYFMPMQIDRFPIYLLAGLLPWNLFAGSITSGTQAITSNSHLIGRVHFPREILPIAITLSNATHFLFALVPLFVIIAYYRAPLGLTLVWLPVILAVQILLTLGCSLFLSAVNVYFRDMQQIVEVGIQALFFLTPIVYSLNISNASLRQAVLIINPLAALIANYRNILYTATSPDWTILAITAGEALLIFLIGLLVFKRLSPTFVEEI